MVAMVPLAFVVLGFAVPAVWATTCSLPATDTCGSGACANDGVTCSWKIPYASSIDSCANGGYGTCLDRWTQGTTYFADVVPATYDLVAKKVLISGPQACCALCNTKGCKYWQYRSLISATSYTVGCPATGKCAYRANAGYCYLYLKDAPTPSYDSSASMTTNVGTGCTYSPPPPPAPPVSSSGHNDPHFVGAMGSHFDFNGLPGKTFCLVTDANLHINMKMTGYLDERLEGAVKLVDGKAVRTWIKELAFMWTVGSEEHSFRLVARSGKETARGVGFLESAEADGVALPRMKEGDVMIMNGGLTVKMGGVETSGPYELDVYRVIIEGVLDMDIRLRVAHKLLRTKDDAEVHINFAVNDLKTTAAVHGVLGQTYRVERAERNVEFAALLSEVTSLPAESDEARGFLDGTPDNYLSSDIMAPDCAFSSFKKHTIIGSAE
eukprot:TRINITY_DN651_c0_g1_i1.p1 TRINITY_DN651_c0_g1~~TRINITY_DN651_c0_g1_i1.p1  ORF type:complete len:438 (-),score=60.08 TRINITY_DN651_c0_g1_i1:990-2303(-)